jgi:hypothetical protein
VGGYEVKSQIDKPEPEGDDRPRAPARSSLG